MNARKYSAIVHEYHHSRLHLPTLLLRDAVCSGGIILPESQKKLNEGIVVAVGGGARDMNGKIIPLTVVVGDKVLLPEYGGAQVKIESSEFTLLRESDLLAIVRD